jgi:two-component system, NtrC family, response regulator
MPNSILVVDDERLVRETLVERLRDEGYEATAFAGAHEALDFLDHEEIDLIITDLRMPSMDGVEFHRRVRGRFPDTAVIFITAFGTVASAVEAMRVGAADYLTKPLNTDELCIRIRRLIQRKKEIEEIRQLRRQAARQCQFGDMVYRSHIMTVVVERALSVADSDTTVLVQGETGTGKEVLCRAIHAHSLRSSGPFVAVNCSGLNPNLVESELFGHEAGAFTGAVRARKGRLETASGGTLFLDEVDDLSVEIQVRLLRFLEDHTFERVGSSKTLRSDVRVLCATKRNLKELVQSGRFRDDLYYRINSVLVALPPLRGRKEDIVPLAEHFLQESSNGRKTADPLSLSQDALAAILAYDWPGNVRELKHALEHAVAFGRSGVLDVRHLPTALQPARDPSVLEMCLDGRETVSLPEILRDCERQLVDWALSRSGGNQMQAAELLSIPRTTLRSRLKALHDNVSDSPDD